MGGLQRNQDLFGALQWSSTREDLFPQSLCDCLGRLHDRAPQHSYKQTRKVILEQFNRPIEDIFDEFPTTPSASGSIAQVNCGW
jgi:aarF domain-containing kinase